MTETNKINQLLLQEKERKLQLRTPENVKNNSQSFMGKIDHFLSPDIELL